MQDHEYSVIGHSRSTIGRHLGTFATILVSLLPAAGVGLSEAVSSLGFPAWSKYFLVIPITAGAIYSAIHWAFNKYGWRPLSYISQIPDISGSWECIGETLNDNGDVLFNWKGNVTISQTWEKIRIRLETETSTSNSVSVALIPEPDGCWMLMYSYKNEPKMGNQKLNSHIGYSEVRVQAGLQTACGEYFTAKGRGTFGRMQFRRKSK